jgi:malate dehydrogenase (quinone)
MFLKKRDLIIIGGGVVGCALYYEASISEAVESCFLFEKYSAVAKVNSNVLANAETLHTGKETNFSFEGALKMKEYAEYLIKYLNEYGQGMYIHMPSMIIGTTEAERAALLERYNRQVPQ